MSWRFDGSSDSLTRAASLDHHNFAACGWGRIAVDRNTYSTVFSVDNTTSLYVLIQTNSDGTTLAYGTTGEFTNIVAVNVGEWFAWYLFDSGTAVGSGGAGIWRSSTGAWTRRTKSAATVYSKTDGFYVGNNGFGEWLNGNVGAFKVWSATKTADQLESEVWSCTPRHFTNLYGTYPGFLHTQLADRSNGGNTLTANGTLATEDGPPITWRRKKASGIFIPASGPPPTINRRRRFMMAAT